MKIINYSEIEDSFFEQIDYESLDCAKEIVKKVKKEKDKALIELSKQFGDGNFINSEDFIVKDEEIDSAYKKIDKELLNALKTAINNVKEFSIQNFS